MDEVRNTDYEQFNRFSHRATIRNTVVGALQAIYGRDNVSIYESDAWRIGICFENGDLVTLQVEG